MYDSGSDRPSLAAPRLLIFTSLDWHSKRVLLLHLEVARDYIQSLHPPAQSCIEYLSMTLVSVLSPLNAGSSTCGYCGPPGKRTAAKTNVHAAECISTQLSCQVRVSCL